MVSDNRLDECEGADAQSEIIRITVSTISDNSLPYAGLSLAAQNLRSKQRSAGPLSPPIVTRSPLLTLAFSFPMHLDQYLPDKIINLIDEVVSVLRFLRHVERSGSLTLMGFVGLQLSLSIGALMMSST